MEKKIFTDFREKVVALFFCCKEWLVSKKDFFKSQTFILAIVGIVILCQIVINHNIYTELENANATIEELEDECSRLSSNISDTQSAIDDLNSDVSDAQSALDDLESSTGYW